MTKFFTVFCANIFFMTLSSAQYYTVSGTLTDDGTGEQLVSANIYNPDTYTGTVTNYYGFYSLKMPAGKVKLVYSYVGYETVQKEFMLTRDTVINLAIKQELMIEAVVISDKSPEAKVRSTQMSLVEIPMQQIKQLPSLLGELDVLKSIQLLPGVQSGTEGLSGLYVRGGGADQNLILLDGVPVYNVNHLFGFFSVFNPYAIHSFKLYKGGFPARYGGRLSSVLDIKMKEGNMKEFKVDASLGLIATSLSVEGPIVKDKASFIISARRTYYDILTYPAQKALSKSAETEYDGLSGYFFQDFNAKVNYKFSDRSRLYLSAYTGKDKAYASFKSEYEDYDYTLQEKMKMKFWWGNITSALRWNYIFSNNLFGNLTATYSRYKMEISDSWLSKYIYTDSTLKNEFVFAYNSGIEDLALKVDFDYRPSASHTILFGIDNTYHTFSPGVFVERLRFDEIDQNIDTTFGAAKIYANEFSAYAEDEISVFRDLKVNLGFRFAGFHVKGKTYLSFEPRLSARYLINNNISVKASYAEMQQNIHLLANSSMSLPTDLWVPVTDTVRPMRSWQAAMGLAVKILHSFEFTIEGYYKEMNHVIEYKEGASYYDVQGNWQTQIVAGKGWSYGAEFMLQRMTGKTTGWIAYTLAWSQRKFDEINFGKVFPYKWDRRHDLAIAVNHKFNNKIDVSGAWVFGSGYPFTFGEEMFENPFQYIISNNNSSNNDNYYYEQNDKFLEYTSSRNNYRLPVYHRLDLNVSFHKDKKKYIRSWSFGAYNVYSRSNPFFIFKDYKYGYYADGTPKPPKKVLKQISFFPVIPYFRYNISF